MFKFLKKENKELLSPAKGKIIPITEVNDPVFAGKMMGDGYAVIPESSTMVSPCDGEIVQVFKTKHAIIIRSNDGLEIIFHVGLDTVALKGEGFDVKVTDGQKVKAGDVLMIVDLAYLQEQGKDIVTPVVITNMDIIESMKVQETNGEINETALLYKTVK